MIKFAKQNLFEKVLHLKLFLLNHSLIKSIVYDPRQSSNLEFMTKKIAALAFSNQLLFTFAFFLAWDENSRVEHKR